MLVLQINPYTVVVAFVLLILVGIPVLVGEPLIDHVANAATYPWIAAIVTALAAFIGAVIAQFFQSRREKSQWNRHVERDRAVRQEERERDRIAWMREDQRRFASDSRSAYQQFLNAAHELDFHLKNVDSGNSNSDSAEKASEAVKGLLKARAEVELFSSGPIYYATAQVTFELLRAFRETIHRSNFDTARQHLDVAQKVRNRLTGEMRQALYKEITLPGETTPEASPGPAQHPTDGDRPAS